MSMARLVVTAVVVEGRSKSEVARDYGLSRRWVITLVQAPGRGEAASSLVASPQSQPASGADAVEDEIVELRKELRRRWPRRRRPDHRVPPRATPGHTARGVDDLAGPAPTGLRGPPAPQATQSSFVRFEADQPNERWQIDTTHWALADGTDVEILNSSTTTPASRSAPTQERFQSR